MHEDFNSLETGKPFTHCCTCDCLLSDASIHVINKSYVAHECIFELAMCMECREDMNSKLSEESRVAMFDFMHDRTDMKKRELELGSDAEPAAYLKSCITCGIDSTTLTNYSTGAMFSHQELQKGPFPILMCSTCEEQLAETISDETRNTWDKFIGEHFPGPPSEIKLPSGNKPLLL